MLKSMMIWWPFLLSLPHNLEVQKMTRWKKFQTETSSANLKNSWRTSLVVQWLRIRLPMQGTRVQALVREDPTCHGATKPVRHNYWACALEPASHKCWAHTPQLLKPTCPEPVPTAREATTMRSLHATIKSRPCSPQLEKAQYTAPKTQSSHKKKIHKIHDHMPQDQV